MDFEQPKKPITDSEASKKKEKRKRKARTPSHIPLPVQHEKEPVATKRKRRAKKSVEKPAAIHDAVAVSESDTKPKKERDPERHDTKPDTLAEDAKAATLQAEDEHVERNQEQSLAGGEQDTVTIGESDELVIHPQDTDDVEGEVFVSDRWRRKRRSQKKTAAARETSDTVLEENLEIPVDAEQDLDTAKVPPHEAAPTTEGPSLEELLNQTSSRTDTEENAQTYGAVQASGGPRASKQAGRTGASEASASPAAEAANLMPQTNLEAQETLRRFRRYEGRNLLTGILIGGIFEHIRHKRREKRTERKHSETIRSLKKDQRAQESRMAQVEQKHERRQTALEAKLHRLQSERPMSAKKTEAAAKKTSTTSAREQVAAAFGGSTTETKTVAPAERPTRSESMKLRAVSQEAKAANLSPDDAERAAKIAAAREAVQRIEADNQPTVPRELAPDRRVEQSAWHTIEVDKKTGKAAENPMLAYGQEFEHEQHQEKLSDPVLNVSAKRAAAQNSPLVDTKSQISPSHSTQPVRKHGVSSTDSRVSAAAERVRDTLSQAEPIDIGLWVGLFVVIVLIVITL